MYNPRLGRLFNVDPLAKKYPELTPYQFASNSPIQNIDLDGLEGSWAGAFRVVPDNQRDDVIRGIKEAHVKGTIIQVVGAGAILTDVFITKGWLSRTMLAYTSGDLFHSMQMQTHYRDQGNEAKAKTYEQEGADASKNLTLEGLAYGTVSKLGAIQKISKRIELAKIWGVASKYVDETKAVFTQTLKEGDILYQYRIPGTDEGSYFVRSLDIKPEQVGITSEHYTEIYKVTVNSENKVLVSNHKKDVGYWRDETKVLEGGGEQLFSKDLKNNASFEKISN